MKKVFFILAILFFVPTLLAHKEKGKNNPHKHSGQAPYNCEFISSNGNKYDFSRLYKSQGNSYGVIDKKGDVIYFNLCGNLSQEHETSIGCDPSSAVCIQTSSKTFLSGGKPNAAIWSEGEIPDSVQVTYSNGDSCSSNQNLQTTIVINCIEDGPENLVISTANYTDCQITIQSSSIFACPKKHCNYSKHIGGAIMSVLMFLCCCSLFFCSCACIRRRRQFRHRMSNPNIPYQPVVHEFIPSQQSYIQPIQLQSVPQYPAQSVSQYPVQSVPQYPNQPISFQPQYFQPSSLFSYPHPPQTPPQIRNQQVFPVSSFIEQREFIVDQDEKIARELQSKFDQE